MNAPASPDTANLAPEDVPALVARRAFLKAEIACLEAEVESINVRLVACGPGEYASPANDRVKVISPRPSLQAPKEKKVVDEIRVIIDDEKAFRKLFVYSEAYKLIKDFRAVSAALLTPARLAKVLALLEKPGTPYVA